MGWSPNERGAFLAPLWAPWTRILGILHCIAEVWWTFKNPCFTIEKGHKFAPLAPSETHHPIESPQTRVVPPWHPYVFPGHEVWASEEV